VEQKGIEQNVEVPGEAEETSNFYINRAEVVHLIQPTRM
jgi:hypothetical protein